jgi:molecular chaperone Hsp33
MSAFVESSDGVVRGLLRQSNLNVSVVVCTQAAREGARRHQLRPVSAALLGQAVTGGLLLASLQKSASRLNLQLEVDGPLRGLFVDAGVDGDVRGYVKVPHLDVELGEGPFRWRAALGNAGFLSVLRDLGQGEYYRSSIELKHLDLALDLNEYFRASDQVHTQLALEVVRTTVEPLQHVAGVLVQALPDGDLLALAQEGRTLAGRLRQALDELPLATAGAVLAALFPDDCEVMAVTPVRWQCTCSRARALVTIASLGEVEVQAIVDTLGSTAVTCQFCATKYEVTLTDLTDILAALEAARVKERQDKS